MPSIPAKSIVAVNPNVLSAGGQSLALIGLVLTKNQRVPIGSVPSFANKDDVAAYFGDNSTEAIGAAIYFGGFENAQTLPAALLFSQYNTTSVAAYLRGGNLGDMTLADLQALIGTLTITVNGSTSTSGTINLSAATSFSNAAVIIQNAFASPGFVVTFDSVSQAFVFTNNTAGDTSTTSFASGLLAAPLALTQQTGAVLSQGALATTPNEAMNAIIRQTTNWATFFTAFDPDAPNSNTVKQQFADWTNQQNDRYMYICWDTDITPTLSNDAATSMGQILKDNGSSGTALVYQPTDLMLEWFISGAVASIDFTQTNGNTDLAFKSQSGLTPSVDDETVAENLLANGYNFYGKYATANDQFIWLYDGRVCGKYKSIRAYVNQIWISNQLQLAGMVVFQNARALPYSKPGRDTVYAAMLDPIQQALNFGAIQPGIELSNQQKLIINADAGGNVADTIQQVGWFLQVLPASPQVRANSGSPPVNFWYTDGGSIHKLNINSTDVQ